MLNQRIAAACLMLCLITSRIAGAAATRIYVGSFGSKSFEMQLREAVVGQLKRHSGIDVTAAGQNGALTLSGFGDIYIKGYLGKNPRVRYVNRDSKPIYGGYLSLELDDADQNPIWSSQVVPSRSASDDAAKDMAEQIVKKLTQFLAEMPKATR